MNKPIYLGLSILDIIKTVMHELWCLTKTKTWCFAKLYGQRQLHCYLKTDDTYKDFKEDVEKVFDFSNYEIYRLLPKGNNEKVIGLMKNK